MGPDEVFSRYARLPWGERADYDRRYALSRSSSQSFAPGSKQDLLNQLHDLVDLPRRDLLPNGEEPSEAFASLAAEFDLPHAQALIVSRSLVETAGLEWTPECRANNGRLSVPGLALVIAAVSSLRSPLEPRIQPGGLPAPDLQALPAERTVAAAPNCSDEVELELEEDVLEDLVLLLDFTLAKKLLPELTTPLLSCKTALEATLEEES
jgi:hypothetical protein